MLLGPLPPLDAVLERNAPALGRDFTGYRNHAYRVANFCAAIAGGGPDVVERIAIAAAFHDLGIWTDDTFDYIPPSTRLAAAYLVASGRTAWSEEVDAMIRQHHKLTPYREAPRSLVEPFRKADAIDVSWGVLRFGVPRSLVRTAYASYPDAGFHRMLVKRSAGRLVRHPLSPLPMVRL